MLRLKISWPGIIGELVRIPESSRIQELLTGSRRYPVITGIMFPQPNLELYIRKYFELIGFDPIDNPIWTEPSRTTLSYLAELILLNFWQVQKSAA